MLGDASQRHVNIVPVVLAGVVMQDVLAMAKASSSHIQPGQPHVESVRKQRCISKILREPPIDPTVATARDRAPLVEHPRYRRMRHESGWQRREPRDDCA